MMRPMTEPADRADEATTAPTSSTTASRLLELQRIDTEADQLAHRIERLAERDQLAVASKQLGEWERARASMRARMDELTATIERTEAEAADVAAHKQRLEAQMKTVIAPREAEALMHEIATLDAQTDALDTAELEALEEQSEIDDRLSEHLRSEPALRDAVQASDAALQQATSTLEAELDGLAVARADQRAGMSETTLARYDRVRSSSGVAVAKLVGHRFEGCHLDLAAAEVDDGKDEAAASDGVAECPNCGRMLAF